MLLMEHTTLGLRANTPGLRAQASLTLSTLVSLETTLLFQREHGRSVASVFRKRGAMISIFSMKSMPLATGRHVKAFRQQSAFKSRGIRLRQVAILTILTA